MDEGNPPLKINPLYGTMMDGLPQSSSQTHVTEAITKASWKYHKNIPSTDKSTVQWV